MRGRSRFKLLFCVLILKGIKYPEKNSSIQGKWLWFPNQDAMNSFRSSRREVGGLKVLLFSNYRFCYLAMRDTMSHSGVNDLGLVNVYAEAIESLAAACSGSRYGLDSVVHQRGGISKNFMPPQKFLQSQLIPKEALRNTCLFH